MLQFGATLYYTMRDILKIYHTHNTAKALTKLTSKSYLTSLVLLRRYKEALTSVPSV